MESFIVCIGDYLNVVVQIGLVIPHVAVEHPRDRPIETFRLVVGLGAVSSCERIPNPRHHAHPAEEFRL